MEPTQATQVSFGNFSPDVTSRELAEFLEVKVGLVLRCKVKNVSGSVPPHAFVHFESAAVAKEACKLAEKKRLMFRELPLLARMDDRLGRRGYNSLKSPANITLVNVNLGIGSLVDSNIMLVSWEGPRQGLTLRIEPDVRRMRIFYRESIEPNGCRGETTSCDIMLEIRMGEVRLVKQIQSSLSDMDLELLVQLWSPPCIFYRTAEDDVYEYYQGSAQLVDDEDPWIRAVDVITPSKSFGKCLDYRMRVQPRQCTAFKKALAYFSNLGLVPQKKVETGFLPVPEAKNEQRSQSIHYFFTMPNRKGIPFDVMFLVNALVHHDIVHDSSLNPDFFRLLRPDTTPVHITTHALRFMLTSYKKKVYDPRKVLKSIINWAMTLQFRPVELKLTEANMIVRRIMITPTRALCMPPEIELSNRVLRYYSALSDRFIRVSFADENLQLIGSGALSVQIAPIVRTLTGSGVNIRTAIYRRVVSVMNNGFRLCGRHYVFLAFSPNQLRDNSAWFFADGNDVHVDDIREWMGTFPGGNVAKYAARMGQCFSSTYSTLKVPRNEIVQIDDVMRNNYNFSDGCGKICPTFAPEIAKMLKLEENPPAAYQIRYAGYKGVVGVWPIDGDPHTKLALRKSMEKFKSRHCQLEIVSWARFLPCFLNRQIITLLAALKVKNSVFIELQDTMVDTLNRMIDDRDLAYSVLMTTCSGELYSTPMRMLCAGFGPRDEPHLRSVLVATRAGQIQELVQKTKIFVPKGRWLLGCLDETGTLEYGQCFVKVSSPQKIDIHGRGQSTCSIISGKVVMTKNPCMHPGDIRVLEATDVPALHHMVDCLVFPKNGPRPHPNEASGSDLDGDVYFVSWDERLVPPSGSSSDPMEYSSLPANTTKHAVRTEHVVDFFAKHMVNDSLGRICNAHVVHADASDRGALDTDCLLLAELAAKAVDYPKTGKPAVMPHDLKPKQYPDFMGKDDGKTYKSPKILGVLYRKVQNILPKGDVVFSNDVCQPPDPTYDSDLEVSGFEAFVEEAWVHKQVYDQKLRAIMSQYNITEEGQIVTGLVILGSTPTSRRLGDIKERVKLAYLTLRKEYLNLFKNYTPEEQDGDEPEVYSDVLVDRVATGQKVLEAKASAWYHVTYHPKWYQKDKESWRLDDTSPRNLLSFAWVAVEYLVLIKNRNGKPRK